MKNISELLRQSEIKTDILRIVCYLEYDQNFSLEDVKTDLLEIIEKNNL